MRSESNGFSVSLELQAIADRKRNGTKISKPPLRICVLINVWFKVLCFTLVSYSLKNVIKKVLSRPSWIMDQVDIVLIFVLSGDTNPPTMPREILYLRIAKILEGQILSGNMRIGDKLPSIRNVQKHYNVSLNTAKQAFLELESKSLVESRPKSGYYVSKSSQRRFDLPSVSTPRSSEKGDTPEGLTHKVFDALQNKDIRQFSLGIPDDALLPIAKLNKGIVRAMRNLEGGGTSLEPAQGSVNLRRNVARWASVFEVFLTEEDVVTTLGTMNALYYCLNATTNRGDTIATESPVYFGILQLAKSMGLKVIELPTHPVTGVDLDALKKKLHRINAVCLISSFSNPLGSLMPEEHKKLLVEMLTFHDIPLIEDDLFGNLFFGEIRPKPCKTYDEAGMVLWCSGVSKTLAPGYRVGWIAPGKFREKVIWQKLVQTVSMPSLFQEVIADFLEHGGYDHHLRRLRKTLHTNCLKFQRTLEAHFPENTKISQPEGGLFLWLELDKKLDTTALYHTAIQQNISFAPGRLFTEHNQFNNCLRLNFALQWDAALEADLMRLGQIIKQSL